MKHFFRIVSRSLCMWVGLIVFAEGIFLLGYTLGIQSRSYEVVDGARPSVGQQRILNLLAEAPVYALPLTLTAVTGETVVGNVAEGANPRAISTLLRTVKLSDQISVMRLVLGANNQPKLVSATRRDLVVGMSVMVIADSDIAITSVITPKEVRILLQ